MISRDPSVSKSNWLHVEIFQFILYEFGVCSINSSKMMGTFPEVLNFDWLFLKLNLYIHLKLAACSPRSECSYGGAHI
jgi:hypothetical protein